MGDAVKKIAVFGSTGSIGTQTLEIIARHPDRLTAVVLTCRRSLEKLREQIRLFHPEAVAVESPVDGAALAEEFPDVKIFSGEDAQIEAAKSIEYDIMLNALVGIAGLAPTMTAIETAERKAKGKTKGDGSCVFAREAHSPILTIALANKETLVTGGRLVTEAARRAGVVIVPVDSEHSAIFQCLAGNDQSDLEKIILTASGGPFRSYREDQLKTVTVADALAHPNWHMGAKITIDSASMINKAFEVIEAKWLFGLTAQQIGVLIHPGSIVHSMVCFRDGAMLAQLGLPSMKVPISYALFYPERPETGVAQPNLASVSPLEFYAPAGFAERSLNLAYRVLKESDENGNDSPAVMLNGADEVLTGLFLEGKIAFTDIVDTIEKILDAHEPKAVTSLDEIFALDAQARESVYRMVQ
jgi:1-deoxy-D-xylulose-5-phosphate reductoisomerase